LPWGIAYPYTLGTMSIYDNEFFFAPWTARTPADLLAARPNLPERLVVFPRAGFNAWNAEYFILPVGQRHDDEERGVLTLARRQDGSAQPELAKSPPDADDYVLLRNPEALPRAWLVHEAEFIPPIAGLARKDRTAAMEKLTYRRLDAGLKLWPGNREEFPWRRRALIETLSAGKLDAFLPGGEAKPDAARIVRYDAQRLEIVVDAERAGVVVLADTYFPGWRATVEGKPAPILRTNRAMRAVPVPAGRSTVIFTYPGRVVWTGLLVSTVGWLAWLALLARRQRPVTTR
jgi:hypothetical protein